MVTYREFISVGLDKCGTDQGTFSDLAALWSRRKDTLQDMSQAEVRRELRCP